MRTLSRSCFARPILPAAKALGLILVSNSAAHAFPAGGNYTYTDLGTLTDRSSWGLGINQSGDICGWSSISGTPGSKGQPAIPFINHAFRWSGGAMIDLGAIPSPNCSPYGCESLAADINDDGLIVGWSATPYQIPFIWSENGTPILSPGINPLPSLFSGDGNSVARAINNTPVVVGECKGPGGLPRRPAKWQHNGTAFVVTDLGTLMSNNTGYGGAYNVNSLGQIVGQATHPGGALSAFLWLPSPAYGLSAGMHDLTPSASGAVGNAINDLGQVVGVIGIAQGFIWLPSAANGFPAGMSLLPKYNGVSNVYPSGINNSGQIVGTAFIIQGQNTINRGVLFIGGTWLLLNNLAPAGSPWTIVNYALDADINDAGEIAGDAYSTTILDINGAPAVRGYLLKPPIPGDINHDGVVNVDDLLAVINAWGPCPAPPAICPADVNGDGVVNVDDLLAVINHWSG